jgi:hypothetical protein
MMSSKRYATNLVERPSLTCDSLSHMWYK